MKFRSIIPWAIFGATMALPYRISMGSSLESAMLRNDMARAHAEYDITDAMLDAKAAELCDIYVANSVSGAKNVNDARRTKTYNSAVRGELPGAPVGQHCLYGQTLQLNRAISERGDTITIVPKTAKQCCVTFKHQMRQKYDTPEYDNCIAEGKMFATDSAYNVALEKHLARTCGRDTSAVARERATQTFVGKNFSAEKLNPGTLLVVPRHRNASSLFHAILYLGRGRIENGEFVADDGGKHVYSGYNRERVGYLFDDYDTNNVFAADIHNIARAEYARELDSINTMPREDLIQHLITHRDDMTLSQLCRTSTKELRKIATASYFKRPVSIAIPPVSSADFARALYVANMARTK